MAAFWFRGTNKSVIYSKYAAYLYYKARWWRKRFPRAPCAKF
jgi:hypothetical protein